jgi:hypothetical protein
VIVAAAPLAERPNPYWRSRLRRIFILREIL